MNWERIVVGIILTLGFIFYMPMLPVSRQSLIDFIKGPPYPKKTYWQSVRENIIWWLVIVGTIYFLGRPIIGLLIDYSLH